MNVHDDNVNSVSESKSEDDQQVSKDENKSTSKGVTFNLKLDSNLIGDDGGQEWFEDSDTEEPNSADYLKFDDSDLSSSNEDIAAILDPNLSKTTQENTVRNSYLGLMDEETFDTTFSNAKEIALCSSEDDTSIDSEQDIVLENSISQVKKDVEDHEIDKSSTEKLQDGGKPAKNEKKPIPQESEEKDSKNEVIESKKSAPKRPPPPQRPPSGPPTPSSISKSNHELQETATQNSATINKKNQQALPVQEPFQKDSVSKVSKSKEPKSIKNVFKSLKLSFRKQHDKNDLHTLDGNSKKVDAKMTEGGKDNANLSPTIHAKKPLDTQKEKLPEKSKFFVSEEKSNSSKPPASPKNTKIPPRPKAPSKLKSDNSQDVTKNSAEPSDHNSQTTNSSTSAPPKIPDQPPIGDLNDQSKDFNLAEEEHTECQPTEEKQKSNKEVNSDSSSISESSPTIISVSNKNSPTKSSPRAPPRPPPISKKQEIAHSKENHINMDNNHVQEVQESSQTSTPLMKDSDKLNFPLDDLYPIFHSFMNSLTSKLQDEKTMAEMSGIDWETITTLLDDSLDAFSNCWVSQAYPVEQCDARARESSKGWNGLIIIRNADEKIKLEMSPSSPTLLSNNRIECLLHATKTELNSSKYNVLSQIYDEALTLEELLKTVVHSRHQKFWTSLLACLTFLHLESLLKREPLCQFDCSPANILFLFSQSAMDFCILKKTKLSQPNTFLEKRCLNLSELLTSLSVKISATDLDIGDIPRLVYNASSKCLAQISKQYYTLPKLCLIPFLFQGLQNRETILFVLAYLMKTKE